MTVNPDEPRFQKPAKVLGVLTGQVPIPTRTEQPEPEDDDDDTREPAGPA